LNVMDVSDTSTHESSAFKTSDAQKGRVKPKAKLCSDVTTELPIIIVGAGLTGLACALVFSDLSMQSVILESRSNQDLISGGMGINLQQKAIECLNELGISTASLVNKGNIILKQSYYCTDGRHVCSLDKSAKSKSTSNEYGQIAIHRGKVLELLLEKVSEKTNVEILNNQRVVDVKNLDKTVSIETKTRRENYTQHFSSSLALGADGINSKVRERIFANTSNKKSPVVYHGITHYRGIAHDFPTFLDGNTMVLIGGTETKFVIYPITSAHEGKQSINWVAAVKEKNVNNSLRQEQMQKHILNILRSDKFHVDFLDLFALVKKTDSIKAWPMIDLEPLDCWIDGRVALIGDAAHAMLPVGSGGAMAGFLDALAMKEAFQKSGPVPVQNVIKLFQVMRYSGASKLQKKCRFQPAEKIVQEVMDQTQLKDVPSSYSDRICNAMKKIHSPPPDNSCNSSNLIGCMELNVIVAQKKNEKVTRALLTTRKETLTESSMNMTQKRKNISNKKRATRIPFSAAVFITMFTLSCFDKAYVNAFQNQMQQQNINGKKYKQQDFLSTKLDSRHSDCLTKIKDLEPLARVGLTTAGQLQKLFSAYYNKPVKVAVHRFEKVKNDSSNVDNRTKTFSKDSDCDSLAVFDRKVAISIGDITFCIAKSKIHVYSPEILEQLISKPIGIGQIFELYDVRPKFTLHDAGRNKDGGVWRAYTLKCDGILSCQILEDFVHDAWNLDLNPSKND